MLVCENCGSQELQEKLVPEYSVPGLDLPVTVVNTASQCVCEDCGYESDVLVPDLCGLISASAVSRVMIPIKFNAKEVAFLRKAIEMTAKDLADLLEVTPETVSRWENDKIPIGPSSEKLLRLVVGILLEKKAPAVDFDKDELLRMKVQAVHSAQEPLELFFEYIYIKIENAKEKKYTASPSKAA